jgi:hypothetical protein
MNAIEAVVEVVKANEELTEALDTYESWFESMVGKTLIIEQRNKNKIRFVTAEVEEFTEGEGWLARDVETDDVFEVTFEDLVEGRAWVERIATVPKRDKRKQRRVTFKDDEEENIE